MNTNNQKVIKHQKIKDLVYQSVKDYSQKFQKRHISQVNNLNGTINMKIHNIFISALGKDIQYYSALVRSLDSSLGNMLEQLAVEIAKISYEVKKEVVGQLDPQQTNIIANLLEKYKRHEIKNLSVSDYQSLRQKPQNHDLTTKRHDSDYYLIDKESGDNYLIELKIGGDLDNKKARSEKEALLEQYAILSNTLPSHQKISIKFATAYNRYGESNQWQQQRVLQYFSKDELLVGCDFWNFICKDDNGYKVIMDAYKESSVEISHALDAIKAVYLK